jgi:beta-aspartyl-peptidase (threonine type)
MRKILLTLWLSLGPGLASATTVDTAAVPAARKNFVNNPVAIVIHGGAGTIRREKLDAATEAAYRSKLTEAVTAGHDVLKAGGSSREAVIAAIVVMEDSDLFNAGHGAVLNHEGDAELDASIMVGSDLAAGAVAGVRHIRNPIMLADRVMTHSRHVMLIGSGAEEFAVEQGFEKVPNEYFKTERRQEQLQRLKEKDQVSLSEADDKFGTVGAVALDIHGVIAAGTYADDNCGISATGHGEYFIRAAVAHDICARARYQGVSLAEAGEAVINGRLVEMGADGGVIGLNAEGNIIMPFNSAGMYRASVDPDGKLMTGIFSDEGE